MLSVCALVSSSETGANSVSFTYPTASIVLQHVFIYLFSEHLQNTEYVPRNVLSTRNAKIGETLGA